MHVICKLDNIPLNLIEILNKMNSKMKFCLIVKNFNIRKIHFFECFLKKQSYCEKVENLNFHYKNIRKNFILRLECFFNIK